MRSTAPSASRWRGRWPRASARAAGTNVGIGITGIAGPGGGTPEKPVGTVAIAVVTGRRRQRVCATFQFLGGREMVKFQAAQAALNMLRLMIAELERTASGLGMRVIVVELDDEARAALYRGRRVALRRDAAAVARRAAGASPEALCTSTARCPGEGRSRRACRSSSC